MYFRKPFMFLQSETKGKGCNALDILHFTTKTPQMESYLCAVELEILQWGKVNQVRNGEFGVCVI